MLKSLKRLYNPANKRHISKNTASDIHAREISEAFVYKNNALRMFNSRINCN